MGSAAVSESLIGVLVAMVGVVTIRRRTPRAIEIAVWICLVWVCVLTVAATHDRQAKALTGAAVWAASSMLGMAAALASRGALQWIEAARFAIADWVVLLCGAELLALAFGSVHRRAMGRATKVWLRDWMELPLARRAQRAGLKVTAADAFDRRLGAWAPVAAAAVLYGVAPLLAWISGVATSRGTITVEAVDLHAVAAPEARIAAMGGLTPIQRRPHWRTDTARSRSRPGRRVPVNATSAMKPSVPAQVVISSLIDSVAEIAPVPAELD